MTARSRRKQRMIREIITPIDRSSLKWTNGHPRRVLNTKGKRRRNLLRRRRLPFLIEVIRAGYRWIQLETARYSLKIYQLNGGFVGVAGCSLPLVGILRGIPLLSLFTQKLLQFINFRGNWRYLCKNCCRDFAVSMRSICGSLMSFVWTLVWPQKNQIWKRLTD